MEAELKIAVATMDGSHRLALEVVIGCELAANHRLIISVVEVPLPGSSGARPAQTLDDWTSVYDGLSDREIDEIDLVAPLQPLSK